MCFEFPCAHAYSLDLYILRRLLCLFFFSIMYAICKFSSVMRHSIYFGGLVGLTETVMEDVNL